MAEVFINYRTGDGDEAAEHLASCLTERFDKEHIFKASRSIEPGETFGQALIGAARECKVLLAIMGPDWATAPQLDDAADWVRTEILTAQSVGARVVPVLKGRKTDRLVRDSLPAELRWLAEQQSLLLDMRESEADILQIGDFLADYLPTLKAADRTADASHDRRSVRNSASNVTGDVTQTGDVGGDMRNNNVSGTLGPTMLGDNNIQHNLKVIASHLKRPQQLPQPLDHLRRLDKRFVSPPGFDSAQSAIRELGTVILTGPPGAGRTAAAQMLVFRSWSRVGMLHELEPQKPDAGSLFHIDPDLIGNDDGMWVDLSDASPQLWFQIQHELPTLYRRAQERHARLVVIQPYQQDLRSEFRVHARSIGRPGQTEVFIHLLNAEELEDGENVPSPAFLKEQRAMAEIRQFVDDILAARDEPGVEGGLHEWITAADQPTSPREALVNSLVNKLSAAPDRALLLSVAMLHGAHSDVIDSAATNLLTRIPSGPDAGLERSPLGERLREIGAESDTNRRVVFTQSNFRSTVPLYFWRHFPEQHENLAAWVSDTLDSAHLNDEDRTQLARRFATQVLDDRYRTYWVALIAHLTDDNSSSSRQLAAAAVLQVGLSDEANSRTFRRQIYDWSIGNPRESLVTVLGVACQQMSETHPDEALVRLHHLARRNLERKDIRDVLVDVSYTSARWLRFLLARLADRNSGRWQEEDAAIFLHIADPDRLIASPPTSRPMITHHTISRLLSAGWATTFRQLSNAEWTSPAHYWLQCAADNDAYQRILVDALIKGARARPDVLSQLYGLVHRAEWRDKLADRVLQSITAVQGFGLPDDLDRYH